MIKKTKNLGKNQAVVKVELNFSIGPDGAISVKDHANQPIGDGCEAIMGSLQKHLSEQGIELDESEFTGDRYEDPRQVNLEQRTKTQIGG